MQVGHVVAAVEVVVDEHFPVAVEDVVPPVEPVQAAEVEAAYLRHKVGAEVLLDRRAFGAIRTNTQFSQVLVETGTRLFAAGSKLRTFSKAGAALSVPSSV